VKEHFFPRDMVSIVPFFFPPPPHQFIFSFSSTLSLPPWNVDPLPNSGLDAGFGPSFFLLDRPQLGFLVSYCYFLDFIHFLSLFLFPAPSRKSANGSPTKALSVLNRRSHFLPTRAITHLFWFLCFPPFRFFSSFSAWRRLPPQ